MPSLIEAIEVKRKMFFEHEGAPYHCLDVEISRPTARGGQTLVRLKMRNLITRAVFDRTFKAGDKFSVRAASRRIAAFSQNAGQAPPPYVTVDADTWTATLEYKPPRTEIPVLCQEQLVVEFYSR